MILGNRTLFVLVVGVSAVLTGCGGGGSSPPPGGSSPTATPTSTPEGGPVTPTPTPTATARVTPTPTPTATARVTPTPTPTFSPTPQPSGPVITVTSRPLTQGDTFAYAGTLLENFLYNGQTPAPGGTSDPNAGVTPDPSGTVAYTVTQNVTDEGTTSFDGATPYDLRTVETDKGTNQTITVTTDTYLSNIATSTGSTGFYTYGFASTDSLGQNITDTLANVPGTTAFNGLLDLLPETQNAHWTNTGAATLAESESDGFTANRVTNADGTYSESDTYPQSSNYTPAPAPITATLSQKADYSGVYDFSSFSGDPTDFTYSAPDSSNTITIVGTDEVTGDTLTYLVDNWYGTDPLYSEFDHQDGALAFPSGCHVPAAFGTTGNAVEQKFTKIDTVIGTLENFDQITYVAGGYAVCTTLNDVTNIFYDYSGQGASDIGIAFNGGTSPVEVATVSSTIGLTSTSVTPSFRRTDSAAKALEAANSARVGSVRTNFLAVVERRRLARIHRAARHLRSLHIVRSHR